MTTSLNDMPEPSDGAMVVVTEWDGDRKVWWRDDSTAKADDAHPLDRWFDDVQSDSMGWDQVRKYADAIYLVNPEPAAVKE